MSEKKENWIKKIARGNRLYWLLAVLAFPFIALCATLPFSIGCRCIYGSARASIYYPVIYIVWARLGFGVLLGEQRKKILIYLFMPIVIGILINAIGAIMGIPC